MTAKERNFGRSECETFQNEKREEEGGGRRPPPLLKRKHSPGGVSTFEERRPFLLEWPRTKMSAAGPLISTAFFSKEAFFPHGEERRRVPPPCLSFSLSLPRSPPLFP